MNTQTPTPRTDAQDFMFTEGSLGHTETGVDVDFARTLELELAEKDAQITNLEQQRDCASDLLAKAETRMLEKDAQIAELNQRLIDRRESFQTQLVRIESTWREKLCEAQAQIVTLRDALQDATDNCLWRSDNEHPLSAKESQRIYNKAITALSTPPPPVVPLEDVKPLVEALRAEIAAYNYPPNFLTEALAIFTTKHPIN